MCLWFVCVFGVVVLLSFFCGRCDRVFCGLYLVFFGLEGCLDGDSWSDVVFWLDYVGVCVGVYCLYYVCDIGRLIGLVWLIGMFDVCLVCVFLLGDVWFVVLYWVLEVFWGEIF